MSRATERLIEHLRQSGEWAEIDGDSFEEQELEDGTRFDSSIEVRETEPAGWRSHYFAELDTEGDWDDPYTGSDDDEGDES